MKLHSRVLYLIVLPVLLFVSFLVHSYISFHSVDYSDIQRIINKNNSKFTKIPSSKPIIRIQTWNIKNDGFQDFETVEDSLSGISSAIPNVKSVSFYSGYKESSWSTRRFGIVNDVMFNSPDIFCVQEAMKNQLDDLDEMLNYQWKWLGVGRDDGKIKGEHTAIFIKRSSFDIIKTQTLWLTGTPYEVSIYEGAHSKRIATLARLKHKISGDKFTIINTHWDHKSDDARKLSASLLRYVGSHEYEKYSRVFLTGDFNSEPTGKTAAGYKILTGKVDDSQPMVADEDFNNDFSSDCLKDFHFEDLLGLTLPESRMGNLMTCTGWTKPPRTSYLQRIDFIMGGVLGDEHNDIRTKKFEVIRFKTGENFYDYGLQLSDHRPVVADVVFY